MIAVIKTGGKQYIVKENDVLRVEKLSDKERNKDKVVFSEVLLAGEGAGAKIGTPTLAGAKVEATILRDAKAKKIRVVKYKPKTRYKREVGHRQPFTEVRIEKITA